MPDTKIKIAFICYGNACRSQLAEGLLRHFGKGNFDVYSAGINPLGLIPDDVIDILNKREISTEGLYSKGFSKIPLDKLDYIYSLLGKSVVQFVAPLFHGTEVVWDIPDPYGNSSDAYKNCFDILEKKITRLTGPERNGTEGN